MAHIFKHILDRSLAHVTRFDSTPQHFRESTAEHSFFVAYITRILCDLLEKKGEKIDKEKAVIMALMHDIEESFSGDILGPFKHYSKEVHSAIAKVNQVGIVEVFKDLPKELSEHYIALWSEEGRGECIEAQVVKVADKLSLIAKCREEVVAGNGFFEEMYERVLKELQEDTKPWWEEIKGDVLKIPQDSN